ncbi:MAG: response regulator [Nitrospirota bacterium]|jgi:CheY-like chemotaxis protein
MPRILLADDSVIIQKVVDSVLSERGFEVASTASAEEALQALSSFQPDLALVDVQLPDGDGYQVAAKMKKQAGIPVVLLAGAFEPVEESRMRGAGADGSLTKPFEAEDLVGTVERFLAARKEGAEKEEAAVAPGLEEEADFGDIDVVEEVTVVEEEVVAEPVSGEEEDLWDMGDMGGEAPAGAAEEIVEEVLEEEMGVEAEEEAPPARPDEAQEEQAARPASAGAPPMGAMPSEKELLRVFREAAHERLDRAIAELDLGAALSDALRPGVRETVEKILWEVTPEITEKLLRDAVQESMGSIKGVLENVIWETVPELAESIIRKEIEKIRSRS